jgi:hypothetical protein
VAIARWSGNLAWAARAEARHCNCWSLQTSGREVRRSTVRREAWRQNLGPNRFCATGRGVLGFMFRVPWLRRRKRRITSASTLSGKQSVSGTRAPTGPGWGSITNAWMPSRLFLVVRVSAWLGPRVSPCSSETVAEQGSFPSLGRPPVAFCWCPSLGCK